MIGLNIGAYSSKYYDAGQQIMTCNNWVIKYNYAVEMINFSRISVENSKRLMGLPEFFNFVYLLSYKKYNWIITIFLILCSVFFVNILAFLTLLVYILPIFYKSIVFWSNSKVLEPFKLMVCYCCHKKLF